MRSDRASAASGSLAWMVESARRRPAAVLAWVLGAHLVLWTALPALVSLNLQLDLVEDLALGKEWQLGYWKHPPLPWWLADAVYRLTGAVDAVYLLGPLAAVVCLYGVWLLAREVTDEITALIAVLALEGIHFFNFSVVKFAHDQMQLPFWAFTGLFFYRALLRGRMLDWALAGVMLAGAFWSKYAAFALAATLGLFLLVDPRARQAWRTAGPYVMALAFAIVIAPNLWWLVHHDFMPFHYVDERAHVAVRWYQYLLYPLQWSGGQALLLVPAFALLALLWFPYLPLQGGRRRAKRVGRGSSENGADSHRPALSTDAAFNRRTITALALGPFLVTTAVAAALGRLAITMWGYPLWSFAPLAALMWLAPRLDDARLRRFAVGLIVLFLAWPIAYVAAELGEPLLRDRPKATQFPGRLLAETVTERWRERSGTPLTYVGGAALPGGAGEFAANNVAVYSPDHPHVIVHGDVSLSPWIDPTDLDRRGAVLVWEAARPGLPDDLRQAFPRAEPQPPLSLPRRTLYPRPPFTVYFAIVPPRP